ncbi:uncharacterized protein LOC105828454 isoform X2 [Monomorium pharaonis]|uniref:uncharacterized protein LOC105828454 isoform X2 n=1 Tax=Monomorium pharaonis TaxID=307658 RepID=UPI001747B533|nr:uncharacterized protein LOC105828454 isoform X2 [Monomorium pharaonis]
MQAAGTLRGTRAISLLVLLVPLIGYAYSSPIQYLPSIPGYVPVYIRYGDEPLAGINPELAEAFGETTNSVKKIDHTLVHESDKDDDINTFLDEPKREHDYPLHVRAAESRSFASANDPRNPSKPKLLNIYTLPDDNDNRPRRRYRGRSRIKNSRKRPAFKNNPLSNEEKEELEKLAIEVEKEETKPNELYAPNPRHPGSPSKNTHSQHEAYDFIAPIKVQAPLDESSLTSLPKIHQIDDFSQSDQNIAIFEEPKEEPPIKGHRPATMWSNVNKLLPIDLPNENKTNKDTISGAKEVKEEPFTKINLLEIPQDTDLLKSSDEHNIATAEGDEEPPIKVQLPSTILSNVDKLSPIDLPNESETNANNKT